ncbi:MAG TPA: hypothetical protein VMH48_09615 [Methylomirabilota bacterium]|nr:hypothetical protein [Methylomirabilota bacterium]
MPTQTVLPGRLEGAYRRELQRLLARNAVARLWAQNASLWPVPAHELGSVRSNLRWLELLRHLGPLMDRVVARAAQIEGAGFEDVLLVSLGPASFAAEAILKLPSARLGKRTSLLRSIDPDAVRALETNLSLERTLFIFVNKLGKDIDNHALFLYFFEQLKARGVPAPAGHFVALAEENSYLEHLAGAYDFIDRFIDPPGILGRFSSLIHFNFYLAAVAGFHPGGLLERARAMQEACSNSVSGEANPAGSLAAMLAASVTEGSDRIVFFGRDSLEPVSQRMGCLVAASTCADGRGIIPIFARSVKPFETLEKSGLHICITIGGAKAPELEQRCEQLRGAGVPLVTIDLTGPEEFAAEFFKWEIATALSCSLLEVNPFHEPDAQERRTKLAEFLERHSGREQPHSPTVRVREAGLELFAEGETRRELSTLNMAEALRSFFVMRRPNGFLALLPFMDLNAERTTLIGRICDQLESKLRIPVLVTDGPRYLYNVGQLYSGGPAKGLVILLTTNPEKDLVVPGADYTLGQIQIGMAQVEFESLGRLGRPVLRLHLTNGADAGLAQLEIILSHLPAM